MPIRSDLISVTVGMRLPLLCLSAGLGALLVQTPSYFSAWVIALIWLLASALFSRQWLLMAAVCTFTLYHGLYQLPTVLPDGLARQDVRLTGHIETLEPRDDSVRLRLSVARCEVPDDLPGCHYLKAVRLNWYRAPELKVGQHWQLTARLIPPHGMRNPGRFDYESWLIHEGLGATGYVRYAPDPVLLEYKREWNAVIEHWLMERVDDDFTRRWLQALTLGEGGALDTQQWALLRETGTTHLAVISGLHVGMVASWMLLLCRLLARLLQPRSWRMASWPWAMAALGAVAYAALSGFAPPAMRAAIMTVIGLWVASGRHAPGIWQAWWLALLIVVMSTPLSLSGAGVWLSFGAVAILVLAWRWREKPAWWRGVLRSQWLLSLGTGAATLAVFGHFVPFSFVINLLAIPWVSMIMVPLALFGWLVSPVEVAGRLVWWLFGHTARFFEAALDQAARWQPDWQPTSEQLWPLAATGLLVCLIWLVPGLARVWRWVATALSITLTLGASPEPGLKSGELTMVVYDVGQGQLIEMRTATSRWLYDSGPRSRSGFMPITTLWDTPQSFDGVMISHGDMDHAGGVEDILAHHTVERWWAPLEETIAVDHLTPCRTGESWRVDGVTFTFLWPRSTSTLPAAENDRSCVLLVETAYHRLLLMGDVGQQVEARIVAHHQKPVDVLIAGHHGSHNSSSQRLVDVLMPSHVIYSAGYLNTYGHPSDEVVRRFRRAKGCQWNTATDGALTVSARIHGISVIAQRHTGGVEYRCPGVESGQ